MGADERDRITVHGPDRAGAYWWKITTDDRPTAERVRADVGATLSAGDVDWQIISPGPLRALVAAGPSGGLVVSFAAAPGARFALAVPSWQTAHLCTPDVWALLQEPTDTAVPGELTVCPVDVTTRGGRLVRYGLPKLTLLVAAAT